MGEVVVVGSLNFDRRIVVPDFPAPGETVLARDSVTGPGGKGSNQAVAARRAGARVSMVGAVGADEEGALLLASLDADGVTHTEVERLAHSATGMALVMVNAAGENSIVVAPGANFQVSEERIVAALSEISRGTPVLLQFEIPQAAVRAAAKAAFEAGGVVILSAAPAPKSLPELLPWVDLLLVNEGELRAVARTAGLPSDGEPTAVAATLAKRFEVSLVCTLGPRGAFVVTGQGEHEQRAPRVEVVDTTAAGDTFAGYLAASLADEVPMYQALARAVAAASITVTREGAAAAIPLAHEVDALQPQV